MKARQIKVHRYPATAANGQGSLLFVHGAYATAGYWNWHFIPFFRQHGYDCFAVDLAGHGASEGREILDEFGIDDYADDVAQALDDIGQPCVVIGHSMGTLVLQRYLEKGTALGAMFLAPVPPTGTAGSAAQLALRYPAFFQALEETISGRHTAADRDLMAKIYFSADATGDDIHRFLDFVCPESERAVAEMALLPSRPPGRRRKLPTLVMGGEEDRVFSPSMLFFTALQWNADVARIPGAGHMLPIDRHWQAVTTRMLEWMKSRLPAEVV